MKGLGRIADAGSIPAYSTNYGVALVSTWLIRELDSTEDDLRTGIKL